MPYCCLCNSVNSKCLGCVCVKNKRRCTNCRPGSLESCQNRAFACETSFPDGSGIRPSFPPASCPPAIQTSSSQDLGADSERTRSSNQHVLAQSTAPSSSSTSFLPSHAAGNTILDAAMAKELSSSCPVELESRSLSSSSSSSTKDAIVPSSKATVDITPAHSLNSNLIEDRTTERGAAAAVAAETSRPLDRPVTSRSPGRADQELPTFSTCSADRSSVVWSNEPEAVDGSSVVDSITAAYSEVVHWRQNLFTIPYGQEGKAFITELTRLLRAFVDKSGLEGIALKASMVLPALVLQRPHSTSRAKDHVQCLSRRLRAWRLGLIDELVREGRTIQKCLPKRSSVDRDGDHFQRTFSNLVFAGKISAAMRLLSEYDGTQSAKGVLDLNAPASPGSSTTVRDVLIEKHPPAASASSDSLIDVDPSWTPVDVHPVYFDRITGAAIRQAALQTKGAAGPSGMNADNWRRICTAFKRHSDELCGALADLGRRLCCEVIDPATISALAACRLIPLDKNPGVRPIAICEVARRIIGKAVLSVVNPEIQQAAGSLQLCAGQPGGIEAAIHAMHTIYDNPDTDGVLLVNARNAFNSLNRDAALHNIRWICPEVSTILTNIYREPAELFAGGSVFLSREGTTQGDPLAMAMYGLAVIPLIKKLASEAKQVWYADDATGGGKLQQLRRWWDKLNEVGPAFGYFPNATKTWLVVKETELAAAQELFHGSGVQITADGHRLLGAPIGTQSFCKAFTERTVANWKLQLEALSTVARTQPQAAYAAFTHGFIGKWIFLARTTAIGELFSSLEDTIRSTLIPLLIGRSSPGDSVRNLLALPPRVGGLGLINPVKALAQELERSVKTCQPLTRLIEQQQPSLGQACDQVAANRSAPSSQRRKAINKAAASLRTTLSPPLQRTMDIYSDKGASHWPTVLPMTSHGFSLPKAAFRDALCMRYNWQPDHLPSHCSCGQAFSVDHALSCVSGGYSVMRHNELRDFTASVLQEVCKDVALEPPLQPLSGEQLRRSANATQEARLDISDRGFWGDRFSRHFLTSGCSTQTPHLPYKRLLRASTQNMNAARDVSMSSGCVTSKVPALCRSCFHQPEEWVLPVQRHSSVLPTY